MEYRFVPAQHSPEKAPTLVILHGHGNYPPARAVYSDWNVFNPLDNYGVDGYGSWWLGEGGDHNKPVGWISKKYQTLVPNLAIEHTVRSSTAEMWAISTFKRGLSQKEIMTRISEETAEEKANGFP